MAFNDTSKINISLKKLSGKAHTSNDKGLANEGLPSGITQASSTIFGEAIPSSPTTTNLYDRSGTGSFQVELVRFECEYIAGTDTSAGRHAFRLKLPSDYGTNSNHGPTGAFVNSAIIHESNGALQLVPPSFGVSYEAKPFYGGSATKNSGTQIPVLDARDWTLDYFNGILFQQDPPGTGDHSNNPDFVEAYLYIGKYLNTVVSEGGGGGGGSGAGTGLQYVTFGAEASLSAERVLTAGDGITIGTANPGQITVSSTGLLSRTKKYFDVTASHAASKPFDVHGINFANSQYDFNKIDVFYNGVAIRSGSSHDYVLQGTGSIVFDFLLQAEDTILVTTF